MQAKTICEAVYDKRTHVTWLRPLHGKDDIFYTRSKECLEQAVHEALAEDPSLEGKICCATAIEVADSKIKLDEARSNVVYYTYPTA